MNKEILNKINEPIKKAPTEIKNIILRVLEIERAKIYQNRPRLTEDIVDIIKGEIHE
jgi:hypothetical protein